MNTILGVSTSSPLTRRVLTVVLGITLMTFATLTLAACSKASSENSDPAAADPDSTEIVPVTARLPVRDDAFRQLVANGNITADKQVTVYSSVAARIVARRVDLASAVGDSEVMFVVDHSALDLAVDQTRAALAAARQQAENLATELARVQRLYDERGTSQQQYDATRTQKIAADKAVDQARAALDQAIVRRNEADVRAPFTGYVGKVFVEVGDMVGPGVPLATVVNLKPIKVVVQIPERDIALVRTGQPSSLTVAAYGDSLFRGTVSRISPVIDPVTRMGEVEVALPNSDAKLKPGMFARVNIEVGRRANALLVPSDAVVQESHYKASGTFGDIERVYYVFVVDGSKAVRKQVTLGYSNGDMVEVRTGLTPADSVVVAGQHLLQDGQRITVVQTSAS